MGFASRLQHGLLVTRGNHGSMRFVQFVEAINQFLRQSKGFWLLQHVLAQERIEVPHVFERLGLMQQTHRRRMVNT